MTEWTELKDLQAVAKAQADGWEIEVDSGYGHGFGQWAGCTWYEASKYCGRPKPVEKKKVKFLAWREPSGQLIHIDETKTDCWGVNNMKRVPNLDLEGEVE